MPENLVKINGNPGIYYRQSPKKRHQGRPDKCYYITYKNGAGKLIREKVGWASEGYSAQLAVHVRGERLRKIRHGQELPDPKKKRRELTFAEAWKKYDEWLDHGKKHAYDDRNRYENHIKSRFGKKALSQITTHDLETFKDKLLEKGLSPATTKHVLVLIRQVYNKMKTWGHYEGESPTKGLQMPSTAGTARVRFLTYSEAKTLLAKLKKKRGNIHDIALLSLHTGMRAGEVFALRWGDVDLENDLVHVADPKSGTPRKALLTRATKAMLQARGPGSRGDYVFSRRGGGKIGDVSKAYLRAVRDLGLNDGVTDRRQHVTFHTLRHTYASWLAIQGTPILEIKELLGHKSLAMTERYAHLIPDQKRTSVNKMETAFNEAKAEKAEK